jgi:hypothetical protein
MAIDHIPQSKIETNASNFFDASVPDFYAVQDRAKELQLRASDTMFDNAMGMAQLGVQHYNNLANHQLSRSNNSLDWFRASLEHQKQQFDLGVKMQQLNELKLQARTGILSSGFQPAQAGGGATGTGGQPSNSFGFRQSFVLPSAPASTQPATPASTPTRISM